MTSSGPAGAVVEATRSGVYDYIVKPFRLIELKRTLDRAFQEWRTGKENRLLRARLAELEERIGKYEALESHRPFGRGRGTVGREAERRYRKQSRRFGPGSLPARLEDV